MLRIALGTLRTRAGSFVGAFVALFCAAALVSGCGMLLQTGLRAHVSSQRYAATPLLVAADQQLHFVKHKHGKTKTKSKPATEMVHLPPAETTRVRAIGGTASVVPEVSFPATVLDRSGPDLSLGHGWGSAKLTPFTLKAGRAPTAADEVVLDTAVGARVGDRVQIQTPRSSAGYRVVGVTAQALPGQRAVFFADNTAARLAGDRLTAIGVWPADGTSRATLVRKLEATGSRVKVYTGADKGRVEFGDAARARVALISMSAVIGGTALLVAILVVIGTLALSIQQRHQEIALLRVLGATPRQVRRMLSRETLVLGVVAAGLGSLTGLPLGHWLHGRFVAYDVIPERLHLITGPLPMLAAALVTLAAGWLATRVAARRPTRTSAAAGLTGSEPRHLGVARAVSGLVLLAAGAAGMLLLAHLHSEAAAMPVSLLTVVVCSAGLMLLAPILGGVAAAGAAIGLRLLSRTTGWLAAENLYANPRRFAAVIAPVTLAVAMAAVVLFTESTIAGAAQRQAHDGTIAAYALRSTGPGVPTALATTARQTSGVAAATQVLHSTVWIGKHHYRAQGVTPSGLDATMNLGVTAGSIDKLGKRTVALSTTTANSLGKQVGGTLTMRLGDGTPAHLHVVAIYTRGLGFGALTLPYHLLAAHVDNPTAATVLIAAPTTARPALHALAAGHKGIRLSDQTTVSAESTSSGNAMVRYLALGLIIAFTAISVVNTLAIATIDRRRELALLRRVGATRRQILRMLRAETLAALVTALVLGAAIGGATLAGFAAGITGSTTPTVTATVAAAIVAAAAVLSYLGTAIPARAIMRTTRNR